MHDVNKRSIQLKAVEFRDKPSNHRDEPSTHLELVQTTVLVVLVPQHVVLTGRPFLVTITFALELLCQVIKTLQPVPQ